MCVKYGDYERGPIYKIKSIKEEVENFFKKESGCEEETVECELVAYMDEALLPTIGIEIETSRAKYTFGLDKEIKSVELKNGLYTPDKLDTFGAANF